MSPAADLARCRWLVLSPHLDDAALSCGGALALFAAMGDAPAVLTICAGQPVGPLTDFARFQHARWGDPADLVGARRDEDRRALALLGATPIWLDVPDCIYRGDRYTTEATLFGPVAPDEAALIAGIAAVVDALWRATARATIVAPLGIGRHVDHQLTRAAVERLVAAGRRVCWYEDFPYVARPGGETQQRALTATMAATWIAIGEYLDRKIEAIATYASQVPTLFGSTEGMTSAVRRFAYPLGARLPGERLWYPAE
ncbi:MAG: PIG-L family deacetylase [Chloroflexi bacterium]|nr:PIG-L family deacetylase [Chloroflexota bacterium]